MLAGDPGGLAGPGIERSDSTTTAELAAAYRGASVTVLPADDEAFGLVLVESLAAGTPVVAARSGGCPEIVDDPASGGCSSPGTPVTWRAAIGEALALAADPATADAAGSTPGAGIGWFVERYEALYAEARLSAQPHEAELGPLAERQLNRQVRLLGDRPQITQVGLEPRRPRVGLTVRALEVALHRVDPRPHSGS